MRSFVKIKSSQNGEITLSFTDIEKSCPSREYIASQICLRAIRENKILSKISGFSVMSFLLHASVLNNCGPRTAIYIHVDQMLQ